MVKLLEENIGENLPNPVFGAMFLDIKASVQFMK